MKDSIPWMLRLVMPRSVEAIVVSLLVLLLLSVGIPSILVRREQARKLQMDERLKNVGLGLHAYHDTFRSFPLNPNSRQQVATQSKSAAPKSVRKIQPKPAPVTDAISPL